MFSHPHPALTTLLAILTALPLSGCSALSGEGEATITDPNSPYYDRACELVQHREHKSSLIADCRCFTNQTPASGIDLCKRPYNVAKANIAVGSGPSIAGLHQAEYFGGFLDESEGAKGTLYVSGGFGPSLDRSGVIIKVDVATGDRALLVERGPNEGPSWGGLSSYHTNLGYIWDVQPAPDGSLLALARSSDEMNFHVIQIDRQTGAVTLKWTTNGLIDASRKAQMGFCETPESPYRLQLSYTGFAVDAQGQVYLPFSNPTQGRGIMRLSADFTRCEVVTGNGIPEATRGEGPGMSGFVQGFTLKDGKLYAFTTQPKQFLEIDLETGDRALLLEPDGVTPVERWARWDARRGVWWLAGMQNGVSIDAFDPVKGTHTDIFNAGPFPWMPLGATGPIQINALNYAPIWLKSDGNLLVAQDGFSIVEYEPSTGNSIILSL